MSRNIIVNKGDRFGKLIIIKELPKLILPSGQVNRMFECKCDCGNITSVRLVHLRHNRIKSCGCVLKSFHGESRTELGILYKAILTRCKANYFEKHLYYEKGVDMSDEWKQDYFKFKDWALKNGYEKGLQIDRIDNSKGYSKENCRFVTCKENVNNRDVTFMVEYQGINQSLQLLLVKLGNPNKYATIRRRILAGWDIENAIFKKPASNYSSRKQPKRNTQKHKKVVAGIE